LKIGEVGGTHSSGTLLEGDGKIKIPIFGLYDGHGTAIQFKLLKWVSSELGKEQLKKIGGNPAKKILKFTKKKIKFLYLRPIVIVANSYGQLGGRRINQISLNVGDFSGPALASEKEIPVRKI
jgi:hypothetical protein